MTVSDDALHPFAAGPVATVYSGPHAGRSVVYKVYPKGFDKRTAAAFTREQAALPPHPAILPVEGVERLADGRQALRTQLCAESLAALVRRVGALPTDEVITLGHAIAAALAAAHKAGVVHGGVTPLNVLFRPTGEPALADFGVTLRHAFARDPLHGIEYLPPETLRTGTLNEHTDLYGLGAVLHFALTAGSPHPSRLGEQPGDRVLRVLGEPVPAINRKDVPVALATVVGRLLATEATHRPLDAATVADQLATLRPGPVVEAIAPNPAPPPSVDGYDDLPSFGDPPSTGGPDHPDFAGGHSDLPSVDDYAERASPDEFTPVPGGFSAERRDVLRSARVRPRYLVAAGAGALALLALTIVLLVSGRPDIIATTPRPPLTSAPPSSAAPPVEIVLATPKDLGDQVVLTWHSNKELRFLVHIAVEGEANQNKYLGKGATTYTVAVDPTRKYCFVVQGSDSVRNYESEPVGIREAKCRE